MMNPGSIMKLMSLKNKFAGTHPKFVSFLNYCFSTGIEVTITKPGENPVTANMKVQPSDIELVNELKNIK